MMSRRMSKVDTGFVFDPRTHMNLSNSEKTNLDLIEKYDNGKWLMEVTKLTSGGFFGELALIDDEPRKATIKCLQKSYFATLGRADYLRMIAKLQIRNQMKKIEFLKKLPFLKMQTFG